MSSAYVDSSIILRIFLREPTSQPLPIPGPYSRSVTSEVTDLECRRVLDRIRIEENLPDEEVAMRYDELGKIFDAFEVIALSKNVLARARDSFPTVLRTLDAIHLSSALLFRSLEDQRCCFLTLDRQQRIAAQALGFETT